MGTFLINQGLSRFSASYKKWGLQFARRWRWFALLTGLLITFVFELFEGHNLDDLLLWVDVIIVGLLIASIFWILLTLLTHDLTHQAESEARFTQYQSFTQQLFQRLEKAELTQFIAEFASSLAPVSRAELFIYDHRTTRLELAAHWPNEPTTKPSPPPGLVCHCQSGLAGASPAFHPAKLHPVARSDNLNGQADSVFCLPLSYHSIFVGAIHLTLSRNAQFAPDQTNFIITLAPEIALALILSIAHPHQIAQVQTQAQMDERQYIAYVLHNSLAQQIGYLHLSLDRLASDSRLHGLDNVHQELEHLRLVASDAYERIRNTLTLLRSPQHVDLALAIAGQAQSITQPAGLQVQITTLGEPRRLAPETCHYIVTLVQEGLNNSVKHAQAHHLDLKLEWSSDDLRVTLIDDGIGFDPATLPPTGHYGITMLREQIKTWGGTFNLESAHGQGTRLAFTFPLPRLLRPSPPDGVDHLRS